MLNGRDGILYGVFTSGGTSNLGRLFALNKDGSGYHVLRDFTGVGGDGSSPNALIDASDQLLYGTTLGGGTNSGGTVFKIAKNGNGYIALHHFGGGFGMGRCQRLVLWKELMADFMAQRAQEGLTGMVPYIHWKKPEGLIN